MKLYPRRLHRIAVLLILVLLPVMAILSVLGIIILQPIAPAYGHSLPVTYSIEPNSILKKESVPSQLTITFSERPDPKISYIHILNSKNERVDNDDFTITGANGRQATVTLDKTKMASDSVYSVTWRTMSLDDGHIAEGGYVFGVGNVLASNIGNNQQSQLQTTTTTTSVTSTFDALIKWPLIVSQSAIVGGVIAHVMMQRDNSSFNMKRQTESTSENMASTKRFALILIASAIAIIVSATASIFLQANDLVASASSQQSQYIIPIVQALIFNSPTGTVWIMRIATSVAIAAISVGYYYNNRKTLKMNKSFILPAILIAGAISIFSNSILSHNSAASFYPSIAIIADWLHFVAVSAWVGGLFYFSSVLMFAIRYEESEKSAYHLSLALPRFSLLATLSLGVIGITGIYMAWLQLHNVDSLFNTQYGITLIIKLSAALPMVLLGAYHQIKLHKGIVMMAKMGKEEGASASVADKNSYSNSVVSKFSKTVKIESLIGIAVLLAASFLTITSPPSHMMHQQQSGAMSGMAGVSNNGNNNYLQEAMINGVDTSLAITPFHAGFNTFTVTLHDTANSNSNNSNQQYPQNIKNVFLRFTNTDAGIGPIVATLNKTGNDGGTATYSDIGGYLSQAGSWKIDLVVQRINAYDLNHNFEANVSASTGMDNMGMDMGSKGSNSTNNAMAGSESAVAPPAFDSFAWLAIGLSIAVVVGSAFYFMRSKKQLRQTIKLLEKE